MIVLKGYSLARARCRASMFLSIGPVKRFVMLRHIQSRPISSFQQSLARLPLAAAKAKCREALSKSTPPQAVGLSRGLVEQAYLRIFDLFVTLNVFANHFCRHFVADRSGEVAVFPELAAPQLPLDLWKLAEHGSRTQTFEPRHHLRYRVAWRERAEQMHMLRADFHLVYRDVVDFSNLFEHLFDSYLQRTRQDALAVLRRPDQVVCGVIGGVRGSSKAHARILLNSVSLRAGIEPPRKLAHPSPPQAAGH